MTALRKSGLRSNQSLLQRPLILQSPQLLLLLTHQPPHLLPSHPLVSSNLLHQQPRHKILPLRRSSRSTKGQCQSTRLSEEQPNYTTDIVDKIFLSSSSSYHESHADTILAYEADLHTNLTTGKIYCHDPRAYAAKTKKKQNTDIQSYHDAMTREHALDYQKAMVTEIRQLVIQNTWKPVDRATISRMQDGTKRPILKGMWAFKLKQLPDGTPLKFKARYCVRGHAKGRNQLLRNLCSRSSMVHCAPSPNNGLIQKLGNKTSGLVHKRICPSYPQGRSLY